MTNHNELSKNVLYVITCAARSAQPQSIEDFVMLARRDQWDIYVIATPQATKFINIPLLEQITKHAIYSEYRHPDEQSALPKPDIIVVFPATFNTLNKWALGITDTLALGILCEYTGLEAPIVAIPCIPQESLAKHRIFSKNLSFLEESGIHILYDPKTFPPMNNIPFEIILQTIHQDLYKHTLLPSNS
jgi:phosphopantothenoylcysteine synthetase/decarboxylase